MYWSGKKYKPVLLDARVELDEHLATVNPLLSRLIAFLVVYFIALYNVLLALGRYPYSV